MIIFDLDGTLADCEHRRHFVDPSKNKDYKETMFICECKERVKNPILDDGGMLPFPRWVHKETGMYFKPNWQAFYEACDKDNIIESVGQIYRAVQPYNDIQIWSGRCESVYQKTFDWLWRNGIQGFSLLKMRPIGDSTPDDKLKEKWLDETYEQTKWGSRTPIKFVFDDRPKVVRMWRSRAIFVFNCCQHDEEF